MKRYYGIIDEDGILSETGTNRKELEKKAKERGEGCDVVNIAEGVFQYVREVAEDEALHVGELSLEYDSRLNDEIYYLKIRHITVGDLKETFKDLPDDTEIIIWDTDSRIVKGCVGFCMNGDAVQLEAETWGRSFLKK